jgi:hypothetical protein
MILVKKYRLFSYTPSFRTQGVYCAVGNGLLLEIVSGYVRCCQDPSLRALNQVPAGRLALTVGHLPLPAVAQFQTLASSYRTSAIVVASRKVSLGVLISTSVFIHLSYWG